MLEAAVPAVEAKEGRLEYLSRYSPDSVAIELTCNGATLMLFGVGGEAREPQICPVGRRDSVGSG